MEMPREFTEALGYVSMSIAHAIHFATAAHKGQERKYSDEPYIVHPISVAKKVTNFSLSKNDMQLAIIVALLHDVVEDTDKTHEDILNNFGYSVSTGVWFLTDIYGPHPELNRELRKQGEASRLVHAPDFVKLVKWCDIVDNSISIEKSDPEFYEVFNREKEHLIQTANLRMIAQKYTK